MKYFIRYLLFKLLTFSTCVLPLRFGYWIALRVADLGYFIGDRRGRKAVIRNLHTVLPDAGEQRIIHEARWVFRNWGKYLCEFFRFREFDEQYFIKHCSSTHLEHVTDALKRGKGVIILSAHFGNWEMGAAYYSVHCGFPVNSLVVRQVSPLLENLFLKERSANHTKLIYIDDDPRKMMRALRNNEMVCILGDRDPTGGGIEVDFFGRKCRFPQGPARLAVSTGCAIVPGVVLRRSNDSFVMSTHPMLEVPEIDDPAITDKKGEQVRRLTQAFAHYLENEIREHPEQWPAFYDVWGEEWKQ
ncbi:MAG: lysophospholipid acyltransferase family protein [Planctomycetes bacterium]|nr:lysophospholipid acyltransferase family protein [Planctomycetota bacterium]